jgi:hypothetical protein
MKSDSSPMTADWPNRGGPSKDWINRGEEPAARRCRAVKRKLIIDDSKHITELTQGTNIRQRRLVVMQATYAARP